MHQVAIEFKKIYEHDMDLLILEEFISDRKFARLFLDKLHLQEDYTVVSASHSLADADGESDITFILQYPDKRIALLIEDKIDAQTMQEQSARYDKRAQKAIARGEYHDYRVMLVAPADYHEEHKRDKNANYEYRVRYEELLEYFRRQDGPRAAFKAAVIEFALKEKRAGYQVQEVPAVTLFWIKLRQFCKENYPNLSMVGTDAPKGANASWPEFRTSLGTIKVIYKSQSGCVDLEFPRYGDRTSILIEVIKDRMTGSMRIWNTGKSASVRLSDDRWKLSFAQDFDRSRDIIDEVLQAVSTLCAFADKISLSELY